MKTLHRFLVGLATLFLLLIGIGSLLGIVFDCSYLTPYRNYVLALGTMCSLVGALLWWTSRRVAPAKDRVWFKGKGGRVSIGVDVIERHIAEVADEFPSIIELVPVVTPAGRGIDIDLGVHFEKGTMLPDITPLLQERTRDSLSETMGSFAVRKINVKIEKVGGAAAAAAVAESEEAPSPDAA